MNEKAVINYKIGFVFKHWLATIIIGAMLLVLVVPVLSGDSSFVSKAFIESYFIVFDF